MSQYRRNITKFLSGTKQTINASCDPMPGSLSSEERRKIMDSFNSLNTIGSTLNLDALTLGVNGKYFGTLESLVPPSSIDCRSNKSDSLEEMPRGGWAGQLLCCVPGYQTTSFHSPAPSRRSIETQSTDLTQQLPDEEELNQKFLEVIEELDLSPLNREAMINLPVEKKWQIYCTQRNFREQEIMNIKNAPDYYIERVQALTLLLYPRDEEELKVRADLMDSLKTALRTQPMSFVNRFLQLDGLGCLLNFLQNMDYETSQSNIHTSIIGCLKAIMNSSQGRSHVLNHVNCINIIVQSLSTENIKTKTSTLEILGGMCLVPGGHKKVLDAMYHYQQYACERTRFQRLVYELGRTTGTYKDETALKTAIMSFINAAINYGAGQDQFEFRLHLRYEFLMLGIQPVLEKLRKLENATLDRHIDFFEMVQNEDERELAQRFNETKIDALDSVSIFEALRKKLSDTAAYPHFLSVLEHAMLLPIDVSSCLYHWQLLDKITQQLALHQHEKGHIIPAAVDSHVSNIFRRLGAVNVAEGLEQQVFLTEKMKMASLEDANNKLSQLLDNKDRLLDEYVSEKAQLCDKINLLETKCTQESLQHLETQTQLAQLSLALSELKLSENKDISNSQSAEVPTAVPPPPLPPPPPAAPLPPVKLSPESPDAVDAPPAPVLPHKQKNVPKPNTPMKSFNWSKLPESKLNGTVWLGIDDEKLYTVIDLQEFESNFSAYQRRESLSDDIRSSLTKRTREVSRIDGRRAQNCTIVLSKLKMSNTEIAAAIRNMDIEDQIPKDLLEQMLKFIPTSEEIVMLAEHSHEVEQMARADRFMYEMSQIIHYEERLKALCYKKKFAERVADIKPKLENVKQASKEIYRSKRLRQLLEIILAFGNYMNRGQRGNALGFKLSSLNNIVDTKSSIDKSYTLLHYLMEVLEQKFPDVLQVDVELAHVPHAAKVNLVELEKELHNLRKGLKNLETEVQFHKSNNNAEAEFVQVMTEFMKRASISLMELEERHNSTKQWFERVCKMFGENGQKTSSDEIFGIFDQFLCSAKEAKADNDNVKRKKQEEEKRIKMETEQKKKTEIRKRLQQKGLAARQGASTKLRRNDFSSNLGPIEEGEFDNLISVLQTGDVFGDDLAKLSKNRRRRSTGSLLQANGAANRERSETNIN